MNDNDACRQLLAMAGDCQQHYFLATLCRGAAAATAAAGTRHTLALLQLQLTGLAKSTMTMKVRKVVHHPR